VLFRQKRMSHAGTRLNDDGITNKNDFDKERDGYRRDNERLSIREPRGFCTIQYHARVRGITRRGILAGEEGAGPADEANSTSNCAVS
jgi:hypothetical protein